MLRPVVVATSALLQGVHPTSCRSDGPSDVLRTRGTVAAVWTG